MDSGGAGRTRGGLGTRRALRLTRGTASYSLLADGAVVPPFGILGGETGAPVGSYVFEGGVNHPFPMPGKVGGHALVTDDVIVLQSAGGGGYGDPLERSPARVLDDVVEGYVSEQSARDLYGVVVVGEKFDVAATERLRDSKRAARHSLDVSEAASLSYESVGRGTKRIARLHPDDAAAIGADEDQMVELLSGRGAPLRAWVRVDNTIDAGSLPLDQQARRILKPESDERIYIRPLQVPRPS